jgi:hypothetical protein
MTSKGGTMTPLTIEDIEAALAVPAVPTIAQSTWVQGLADGREPTCADDTLCELACERDPRGPAATIRGLIEGLLIRHDDDPATVAALTAIATYHLPDLIELRA